MNAIDFMAIFFLLAIMIALPMMAMFWITNQHIDTETKKIKEMIQQWKDSQK